MAEYRRRFELAVVAVIFGLFAVLLLRALERVQRDMEEAQVQAEAGALRIELLDRLSHHQAVGGKLPDSLNPVVWTGRAPVGYLGEFDEVPTERGVWYFQRRTQVLAYRYRHGGEARFRLVRLVGAENTPAVLAGIGLARLENER